MSTLITVTSVNGELPLVGQDSEALTTIFDAHPNNRPQQGPTPMSVMLQSLAACSAMDVIDILAKKRRTLKGITVDVQAERSDEHPRVYTSTHLVYTISSPDATEGDVRRCVELSQEKYCSVSAMFRAAGCVVTWDVVVHTMSND